MAEFKNGRIMQNFQIVTDAAELEQFFYFKSFAMKEAKFSCLLLNGNCSFLKFVFWLLLFFGHSLTSFFAHSVLRA